MVLNPEYLRLRYLVEEHLTDFLPEESGPAATLSESMRYSLSAGGKRLRPVLLLAACELAGGETIQALPYACAIEYIHTYSLIHDDLPAMDDDDLRRGKPTNHKVYGEATAILAGDGLLSAAFETIQKDMLHYFDRPEQLKQRVRAANEIAKGCGCRGMVAGQLADMEAGQKAGSAELLDYIHAHKTAALIESALLAGAYLGGGLEPLVSAFSLYGENLGLAFQIADDMLDVIGTEEALGKQIGQDQSGGKMTWPAVHGLEKSRARLAELTGAAVSAMARIENAEFFIEMAKGLAERTS